MNDSCVQFKPTHTLNVSGGLLELIHWVPPRRTDACTFGVFYDERGWVSFHSEDAVTAIPVREQMLSARAPMPILTPPPNNTTVWRVSPGKPEGVSQLVYYKIGEFSNLLLNRGELYATRADAEAAFSACLAARTFYKNP